MFSIIGRPLIRLLNKAKKSENGFLLALFILGLVSVIVIVISFIGWYVEYKLWNAVVPQLFGFSEASFWQIVGLDWLLHMLFNRSSSSSEEKEEEE